MSDAPDWQRLGAAVRARRHERRLSPYDVRMAGGPSPATVQKIEAGAAREITSQTKDKLEHALGWTLGSVDAVLAGGEPTLALPPGTEGRAEVLHEGPGERIIIDIVTGLGELTEADRREILALIQAKQRLRNP